MLDQNGYVSVSGVMEFLPIFSYCQQTSKQLLIMLESKMRIVFAAFVILFGAMLTPSFSASVEARIDLSNQTMRIYQHGRLKYTWAISSGRKGYRTPTGTYKPQRMYREYYSRKYDNAPMPFSIFFRGGYAIHGTNHLKRLGRTASHGCIRLHPSNAQTLYNMVRRSGAGNTRIRIAD